MKPSTRHGLWLALIVGILSCSKAEQPATTTVTGTVTAPPVTTSLVDPAKLTSAPLPIAAPVTSTTAPAPAKRRPSDPPSNSQASCDAATLATAERWVTQNRADGYEGYEYLLNTSPNPRGWCGLIPQLVGDPVIDLCEKGYDSPRAERHISVIFDYFDLPPTSRYPYARLTYHGKTYYWKVDQLINHQTANFDLPCWSEFPVANEKTFTFDDHVYKVVTVP